REPADLASHPQLAGRDRWREVATPGGPVQALLPPVTVPGREAAMGAVPAVGEHSQAIRAELGLAEVPAMTSPSCADGQPGPRPQRRQT
ncbi:MAG: hypothetical protein ACLP7J_24685, partial [Streptosporangiaceae bacterium]